MNNNYGSNGMAAPKKPMSLWWPMSLLIAWIVFFAIGAGLVAASTAQINNCVNSFDPNTDTFDNNCDSTGPSSLWIGGVACFAIGGILHLPFWILLVVWFVKRSHYRRAQNQYVHNNPGAYNNNYQSAYPQQQQQMPQPQQPQQPYYNYNQQQPAPAQNNYHYEPKA